MLPILDPFDSPIQFPLLLHPLLIGIVNLNELLAKHMILRSNLIRLHILLPFYCLLNLTLQLNMVRGCLIEWFDLLNLFLLLFLYVCYGLLSSGILFLGTYINMNILLLKGIGIVLHVEHGGYLAQIDLLVLFYVGSCAVRRLQNAILRF